MTIHYEEKLAFFKSGKTRTYEFRVAQLENLKKTIEKYESDIIKALTDDLRKPSFEAYTSEIAIVYQEINHALKELEGWMKPIKVKTPLYLQPASSYIYPQPKGLVFILSPWNYPFQLAMAPLVGALAAGNCILVKPSNKTPETANIIQKIIHETFKEDYISVLMGSGSEVVDPILDEYRFDHIFFTGSQTVGKHIMHKAADKLTPVTLELGGKSPALVLDDADLDMAAKRIVWGKFYNAGQTCVGVDYVLVDHKIKDAFIDKVKQYIRKYYGKSGFKNISSIVDDRAMNRLISYRDDKKNILLMGGAIKHRTRQLSPTVIDVKDLDTPIMKEEIFGPIMPIVGFDTLDEAEAIIAKNPNPLALYVYTMSDERAQYIINTINYGGGAVNHNIVHLINSSLPFGGINESGMGAYHAEYSFDVFSHRKSMVHANKIDTNVMYPPYNKLKYRIAQKVMK